MKFVGPVIGVLIVACVACFVWFVVLGQPGSNGVVASLRLPDGSQYMVTQRYNKSLEPYTVAFYMRQSPTQKWGWCYIDHQAARWNNVAIAYDSNADIITVKKHGVWQATLDRKRNTFAIGDGTPKRELAAPQEYREPEFPFR